MASQKDTHEQGASILKAYMKVVRKNGAVIEGVYMGEENKTLLFFIQSPNGKSWLEAVRYCDVAKLIRYPNYDLSKHALICRYVYGCLN
tara:strand:+ start:386 stop:652 length:267 start_codon:yes stop_codon:yes gene_type:complete